ncbi:cytochrome C biogenesis protein [Leptospira perolatii]|uniref:Cytochrome c-type biogenesis protein n=1 Tax=Leptospira perolatii TaxID=2023191 RepID=A0A2M9ZNF6_9LEPT|nr:cytochrome c-type biogenesis protein CcmH [Leptospira perolatii]PJZ69631.1 cytochrome C biogenesis protein [Leptospira perolatii]PJZ73618.1 cytochrome C biogenesis protein [Leptospira perolatii]
MKAFGIRFLILSFCIWILSGSLVAESTFTNLTDHEQVKTFLEVTNRIRCICLPSIPIKSCSFNNCTVSAKLKLFIENRIRKGESADTIVNKMINGFGEEALQDPVIAKFAENGNDGIVQGVVYGFGQDILAKPDSTWINLSLALAGGLGLIIIFLYLKRRTSFKPTEKSSKTDSFQKYLSEIEEKQK